MNGQIVWVHEKNHIFANNERAWFTSIYENFKLTSEINLNEDLKYKYKIFILIEHNSMDQETISSYDKKILPLVHEIFNQTNLNSLNIKPNAGVEFSKLVDPVKLRETAIIELLQPWYKKIFKKWKK